MLYGVFKLRIHGGVLSDPGLARVKLFNFILTLVQPMEMEFNLILEGGGGLVRLNFSRFPSSSEVTRAD